jgi:hypothetical protein
LSAGSAATANRNALSVAALRAEPVATYSILIRPGVSF